MVIEEGFKDTMKKIGKGITRAKNTYNYYMGKRSTKYNFAEDAPSSVINATVWKDYRNDGTKYKAKMDRDSGRVQVIVDAEQVGKKAAPLLNPKSEDKSLLQYLQGYDKQKKELTLVFPITDKNLIKRLKDEADFDKSEYEKSKESDNTKTPQEDRSKAPTQDDYEEYGEYIESIDLPLRIRSGNNNSSIKFL